MSDHTKEPWLMCIGEWEVVGPDKSTVARCKSFEDARLIAAAPDLLKALQSINRLSSPSARTLDDFIRDMDHVCDIARAVIAKATGGK